MIKLELRVICDRQNISRLGRYKIQCLCWLIVGNRLRLPNKAKQGYKNIKHYLYTIT